ncbi:MAG: hypothetical protein EU981_03280 [Candidatus Liberibacter ctenarytainae]|uniref:Uncharacterized protein n=1 Tax=Candidatus Liberibacter ctenarytainae TaxID=2020335 RepID=A0A937DM31_9HYPH|nr:hypothetical protein [Candidatus Liberibacter ctenarytainae]
MSFADILINGIIIIRLRSVFNDISYDIANVIDCGDVLANETNPSKAELFVKKNIIERINGNIDRVSLNNEQAQYMIKHLVVSITNLSANPVTMRVKVEMTLKVQGNGIFFKTIVGEKIFTSKQSFLLQKSTALLTIPFTESGIWIRHLASKNYFDRIWRQQVGGQSIPFDSFDQQISADDDTDKGTIFARSRIRARRGFIDVFFPAISSPFLGIAPYHYHAIKHWRDGVLIYNAYKGYTTTYDRSRNMYTTIWEENPYSGIKSLLEFNLVEALKRKEPFPINLFDLKNTKNFQTKYMLMIAVTGQLSRDIYRNFIEHCSHVLSPNSNKFDEVQIFALGILPDEVTRKRLQGCVGNQSRYYEIDGETGHNSPESVAKKLAGDINLEWNKRCKITKEQ